MKTSARSLKVYSVIMSIICLCLISPSTSYAQAIVVANDGQNFSTGRILDPGTEVVVGPFQMIVLLVGDSLVRLPRGSTYVIPETSQSKIEEISVAFSRSIEIWEEKIVRGPNSDFLPASIWTISATKEGVFCFPSLNRVAFWRSDAATSVRARISEIATSRSNFFTWKRGKQIRAWPKNFLPAETGKDYLIKSGPRTRIRFRLEIVEGQTDAEIIAELINKQCTYQLFLLTKSEYRLNDADR